MADTRSWERTLEKATFNMKLAFGKEIIQYCDYENYFLSLIVQSISSSDDGRWSTSKELQSPYISLTHVFRILGCE